MFRHYHHSMDDKYLRYAFKVYRHVLGTITDVTAIFAKAFHVRTNFYKHFCYTTEDFHDYVWEKIRSYNNHPKDSQVKFTTFL